MLVFCIYRAPYVSKGSSEKSASILYPSIAKSLLFLLQNFGSASQQQTDAVVPAKLIHSYCLNSDIYLSMVPFQALFLHAYVVYVHCYSSSVDHF